MTNLLTPPPPKGYFYAVVPVDRYDFYGHEYRAEDRLGFKIQLRKRRPLWFSQLVATVFVKADPVLMRVPLTAVDEAAAELAAILTARNTYLKNMKNVKNVVKETNQRA